MDLLRLLTCGSVDDGKSTLIGRLLYDAQVLMTDQLAALARDSRRHGTAGDSPDFALLLDGLEAEREQGITIDVATRFMATPRRRFIIADTPGHEQYTRNMVTGASTADLAVLLVDASRGLLVQTRRHAFLCALLGIRHIVLAVNKIDLVGFDAAVFDGIVAGFRAFAARFAFAEVTAIPLCARDGDNVTVLSPRTPWYQGPTLLGHLETVAIAAGGDRPDSITLGFRLPVQWVNRPDAQFRGFAGTVAAGTIRPGEAVVVAGSGRAAAVARIVTADGDLPMAQAGDAITLTLTEELDISRGDVLADPRDAPALSDQFAADLVWMQDAPLLPGRSYLFRIGTALVAGSVTRIRHKVDVNTQEPLAAETLALNEIGRVSIALLRPLAFDPYDSNRRMGAFVVIDRENNATAGAGMIRFGLARASNLHRQAVSVDRAARQRLHGHGSALLWFTGLSGAGKSSIANRVEQLLHAEGCHTYLLDGDNVRLGLNRDLGFTTADRVENIRRVGELGRLFVDAGVITLAAFISPFRAERDMVRALLAPEPFLEIFVDTPLAVCRTRDVKGLYRKAEQGLIRNFTGVDSPYEPPYAPDIHLRDGVSLEEQAETVVAELRRLRIIGGG